MTAAGRHLALLVILLAGKTTAEQDLTRWADPLIGTRTSYQLSR